MESLTNEEILERLKQVIDPELGVNVVDLGLIYGVENNDGDINVEMTLTTPGCPLHDTMTRAVEACLGNHPAVKSVEVEIVWSPPWSPAKMTDHAKKLLGML